MSVQFAEAGSAKPSVAELAQFASRANQIEIGGDDIVDLGDNLGLDLLSNPNKVAPSPRGPVGSRQVQMSASGATPSGAAEMPQIQIKPVDDIGIVDLDAAPGASDIQIQREAETPFVIQTGGQGAGGTMGGTMGGGADSQAAALSPADEARLKQGYITKIARLESNGVSGNRVSMANSLEEVKAEYDKRADSRNLEASIRFQRNALMTFVTGVEMVNDKFGHRLPMKPRLKGWSESVHANVEDFDEIFEELYDMYKDKAKMHPLLRLVGTLGVSATMYHLTNTMAERSGIPGMADLLNGNPDLQRQFAAAAAAKMGGLGQFMNAASGMAAAPPPSMAAPPMAMGGGQPMGMGSAGAAPRAMPMDTRVPFNGASAAFGNGGGGGSSQAEAPRARREMRGPTGVDDILKAFETERMMAQATAATVAASTNPVLAPSGPPPTPPRGVQIIREGVGSPNDPLGDFAEDGSVMSGSTMNTERRRGRRRAVAVPVGTTLNLNV